MSALLRTISGKKQKRALSGNSRRTCLQAACGGCSRKSHPHAEDWEQGLVAICHKCNKEWHAQCMAREGIQRVGESSQWECRDCRRLLPAYSDSIDAEETPERQARDTTIVMEELETPRITDDYRDLVSFGKTAVIQAEEAYKEARGRSNTVLAERKTCRERFSKLEREIEHCGKGLEEYMRQFDSDGVRPGDGESEHSMSHQLALGICSDRDWIDKVSDKIDLMRAEEIELTRRLKPIQDDVEINWVEQQHSRISACLRTSCKLKVTVGFIEDSCGDSDCSDSTMEDSVPGDIPPNRPVEIRISRKQPGVHPNASGPNRIIRLREYDLSSGRNIKDWSEAIYSQLGYYPLPFPNQANHRLDIAPAVLKRGT